MTYQAPSPLEQMLRECELGWMIDWYLPPDQALPALTRSLDDATSEAQRRFGNAVPRLSAETLAATYQANPHKIRAFLQALGATRTPEMLVMVWRILHGMEIGVVDLSYVQRTEFHLHVTLRNPHDNTEESYESDKIDDAKLLRHFGIMTIDRGPVFDGFYPLRLA